MDWERLASMNLLQLERNESLLNSAYEFLEANELDSEEAARTQPTQLLRILSAVQQVMKVCRRRRISYFFSYLCLPVAR